MNEWIEYKDGEFYMSTVSAWRLMSVKADSDVCLNSKITSEGDYIMRQYSESENLSLFGIPVKIDETIPESPVTLTERDIIMAVFVEAAKMTETLKSIDDDPCWVGSCGYMPPIMMTGQTVYESIKDKSPLEFTPERLGDIFSDYIEECERGSSSRCRGGIRWVCHIDIDEKYCISAGKKWNLSTIRSVPEIRYKTIRGERGTASPVHFAEYVEKKCLNS